MPMHGSDKQHAFGLRSRVGEELQKGCSMQGEQPWRGVDSSGRSRKTEDGDEEEETEQEAGRGKEGESEGAGQQTIRYLHV